jgi:hypothetical protein
MEIIWGNRKLRAGDRKHLKLFWSRSPSDLAPFIGTQSVNGSRLINTVATGCLIKKLYVSTPYANLIKCHLRGVFFAS